MTSASSARPNETATADLPAAVAPTTATIRLADTAKGYGRRTAIGGNVHRRRVLLATALIAGCATTGLIATTSAGAGPAAPSFSTPTVANFWTPGFEPDLAQDQSPHSGAPIYETWPNGFST